MTRVVNSVPVLSKELKIELSPCVSTAPWMGTNRTYVKFCAFSNFH